MSNALPADALDNLNVLIARANVAIGDLPRLLEDLLRLTCAVTFPVNLDDSLTGRPDLQAKQEGIHQRINDAIRLLVGVDMQAKGLRCQTDTLPLSELATCLLGWGTTDITQLRGGQIDSAATCLLRLGTEVVVMKREDGIEEPKAAHNADFTMVNWFDTKYLFSIGNQAKAVGVLWAEWEKGNFGLHEKTIGEEIGSGANAFRLIHVFRGRDENEMHKAWGKMIVTGEGKGTYKLKEPSKMAKK